MQFAAHPLGTRGELARPFAPAQSLQPLFENRGQQALGELLGGGAAGLALVQHQRPELAPPAHGHGAAGLVPFRVLGGPNAFAQQGFDVFDPDPRAEKDARFPRPSIEFGGHQPLAGTQRVVLGKPGAAAVAQPVARQAAGSALADAIGIGQCKQRADAGAAGCTRRFVFRTETSRQFAQPLPVPAGASFAQRCDPCFEIGTGLAPQGIALAENRGQSRRITDGVELARTHQHVRQARMQAGGEHGPSGRADHAALVECIQRTQQLDRLIPVRARRWIQPRQLVRIARAPGGQFQHRRGQVGLDDLGRRERRQPGLFRLRPEPVAHARLDPPGAATALLSGRARDPAGDQAAHPGAGIEARAALESGVDHHPHALDGQAGFGDRCGQHDLACARRRRRDRGVLLGRCQRPVQGVHADFVGFE